MARICVIHGCKSEYYPDCGLSYHRIPGKETAKQSWLNALPLNSYKQIKENSVICSKHFKPDDYIPGISKAVLKENAIPLFFFWWRNETERDSEKKMYLVQTSEWIPLIPL